MKIFTVLFVSILSLSAWTGGEAAKSFPFIQFNCKVLEQLSPPQEIYKAKVEKTSTPYIRVTFATHEELSPHISQIDWTRHVPLLGVLSETVPLQPAQQFYSFRIRPAYRGLVKTDEVLFVRNEKGDDLLFKVTHNGDPLADSPFEKVQFLKLKCHRL